MFLLYPQTDNFSEATPKSFCFNPSAQAELNLWIVLVDVSARVDDEGRIMQPENCDSACF